MSDIRRQAPWHKVPDQRYICIEHPAIIQNLDRAITTIGGQPALTKLAATNATSDLQLRLREKDPIVPGIPSRTVPTTNILVKITIPKRRKKKRRMNEAGEEVKEYKPQQNLLQKLRDSKGNYKLELLGTIDRTVRFREMADYQWNNSANTFVSKMADTLMPLDLETIKKFQLDPRRGWEGNFELVPPPIFSPTSVPHVYYYHQNSAIKKFMDGGKASLYNIQSAKKTPTICGDVHADTVPQGPPPGLPWDTLEPLIKEVIEHLRKMFTVRPVWSRRALMNFTPPHLQSLCRFYMVYAAYQWRGGPWRDTCCRYGCDPRKDPETRLYQTIFFKMEVQPGYRNPSTSTHIFNGRTLAKDAARCYQLCDITDILLQPIINTKDIRKRYDPKFGWFRRSTMKKIAAIMKGKIHDIEHDKPVNDSEYLDVLDWESETEENEEKDKARIVMERGKKNRMAIRAKAAMRHRHSLYAEEDQKGEFAKPSKGNYDDDEEDEEEEEDEDLDGEWEEDEEEPDERMQAFMTDFMNQQGDIGDDMEDDEDDMDDILEEGDGDDDDEEEEDDEQDDDEDMDDA